MSSTTWTTREVASNAAAAAPRVVARGRGAARGVDDGARRFDRGAACAGAPAGGREAAGSGGRGASALAAVHAVPVSAAARRLALSRPERSGRLLRRRRDTNRLRGTRLLALASSARFAGADGDAHQAANGVSGAASRPTRSTCARSRSCGIGGIGPTRDDYSRCQRFGRTARAAGVGAIRYESVRDPQHAACCAVLSPAAFVPSGPARAADVDAVGRARSGDLAANARARRPKSYEFAAAQWSPSAH